MSRAFVLALAAGLVAGGCARPVRTLVSAETPSPAEDLALSAEATEQRGNVESALVGYRRAVDEAPAAVRPHLRYVRAMLALGRRTALRAEYTARAAEPDATDAERTLAERLATNGASSQLRRVYTLAAERNPASPWWRLALAEVEIAEADAWNQRRLDAIERGDREEERRAFRQSRHAVDRAQRAVTRAAEVEADLAEVHLYRGHLRAIEGDLTATAAARDAAWRAAESAFLTATQRAPTLAEAWGGLGDVRYRLGDTRGSLIAFLEAVRRRPADATFRLSLGVVLHEAERLREAAAQYRQAAALRPWDADPLVRLGDALADDEQWAQALDVYEAALARDAGALEALFKMGRLLEHLDRPAEARSAYERYVDAGGGRAAGARRRIERLLRGEER